MFKKPKCRSRVSRFAALVWLALLALMGCNDAPPSAPPPRPRVKVVEVGREATGQLRRISGKIDASERSSLSFGVGGRVSQLLVEKGDAVAAGQLIAVMDPEPFRLIVAQARAQLTSARARAVEAESVFARTKRLLDQKAASQKALDTATAQLALAKGEVESAQSTLDRAELDLGRTRVSAPFSGRVEEVAVEAFEEVSAGRVIVVLQSDEALEVDLRVPETLIHLVEFGQLVRVDFPSAPGVVLDGTVLSIAADTESGNAFPVVVGIPRTEAKLRPGMTAGITFNFASYLEGKTTFLIPISALALDEVRRVATNEGGPKGRVTIFVLDSTASVVRLREITVTGARGNEVEVTEGLSRGEQVVVAGVAFLRDGMAAEAWQPDSGAAQ